LKNIDRQVNIDRNNSSGVGSPALVSQLMEIARLSALTELASGIAHEINQPLGAIATFAQAGERMLNRENRCRGNTRCAAPDK